MHKSICSDILIIPSEEESPLQYFLISRPLILSGGYDQAVYLTDLDGVSTSSWMITPLPSSLPAVNPPFVTCLARNEMNGNLYCGAMDGSIRFLSNSKDSSGLAAVQPVISCHAAGISDV